MAGNQRGFAHVSEETLLAIDSLRLRCQPQLAGYDWAVRLSAPMARSGLLVSHAGKVGGPEFLSRLSLQWLAFSQPETSFSRLCLSVAAVRDASPFVMDGLAGDLDWLS